MAEFISWVEFSLKYPIGELLAEGNFGQIYASDENIIKVAKEDTPIISSSLIRELNWYTSIEHSCMLKVKHWTFRIHDGSGFTYIVLPKGQNISQAFKEGKVTPDQVVGDTLSLVAYLHSQGIYHGDIKPENIIYHEGKVKLIDFGSTLQGILGPDSRFYVKGQRGTPYFQDHSYVDIQWNLIETELFGLGKSWVEIITQTELPWLIHFKLDHLAIDPIIQLIQKPVSERITARELLNSDLTGFRLTTDILTDNHDCRDNFGIIMNWSLHAFIENKLTAQALFLALHLIHRIIPKSSIMDTHIQEYVLGCGKLACIILDQDHNIKYNHTVVEIISRLGGIILTPTYWDYASCAEDLPGLLEDTLKCDYDPSHIRPLLYLKSNKNILASDITIKPEYDVITKPIIPNIPKQVITFLDLEPDVKYIKDVWQPILKGCETGRYYSVVFDYNLQYIHVLYKNKDCLKYLDVKTIGYILYFLTKYKGWFPGFTKDLLGKLIPDTSSLIKYNPWT